MVDNAVPTGYVVTVTTLDDEPMARKVLRVPQSMAHEINRWRHKQEIASENEAMRQLLRQALDAQRAAKPARKAAAP